MHQKKVWLVTGASRGLGLSLVQKLLAEGHQVAATSRTIESLQEQIESSANFLPLMADVTDENSVNKAVEQTVEQFGRMDVIVNNAGYGQLGTIEELSDAEARQNFDANVFGVLNVMRAATPYLRRQGSGHVINISSIVGFYGEFGGWGIYNATKFAVAGLTEAFSAEVKPFGIRATIVYPGYFRTGFLNSGSLKTAVNKLAEYKDVRASEKAHINDIAGNQPGNPDKAAIALLQLADNAQPPLHLFLGTDSYGLASSKVDILQQALAANQELSRSTDY